MDFDLSADQLALREAVEELLTATDARQRARAVLDAGDGGAGYDPTLWRHAVEQGWLSLALPERYGGLDLGYVEVAVLAERIGAHVAPVPALSSILATSALVAALDAGTAADRAGTERWLASLAAGEVIGCVGWGDGPVADAPYADLLVQVGQDAVTAYPLAEARPRSEPGLDGTRRIGQVEVAGRTGLRLGGADLAETLLDQGATVYAAELLGLADRMLWVTVEYAKVREQFGRPIGSFQAVKHRLAEMLVDVEGMRSAAYYAAWAVSAVTEDRALAASTAKAWCGDAGRRVLDGALQMHGGIGFTWEHDLHLYLKRGVLDQTLFGAAGFHRRRIGRLLAGRVGAGESLW